MPMKLYVGDVIQTRKKHPCRRRPMGNYAGGDGFSHSLYHLRPSSVDSPCQAGEIYQKGADIQRTGVIRTADVIVMKIFACGNC